MTQSMVYPLIHLLKEDMSRDDAREFQISEALTIMRNVLQTNQSVLCCLRLQHLAQSSAETRAGEGGRSCGFCWVIAVSGLTSALVCMAFFGVRARDYQSTIMM